MIACANEREEACRHDGDPAAFLWRARRAVEAILFALAQGTQLANPSSASKERLENLEYLANQLVKADRLSTAMQLRVTAVRAAGNLGVHAKGPDLHPDATVATVVLDNLPSLVEWLYEKSPLARDMPSSLRAAVRDLRSHDARPAKTRVLEARVQELERRELDLEAALQRARTEHEQLQLTVPDAATASATPPNAHDALGGGRPQRASSVPQRVVALAIGAVVGAGGAVLFSPARSEPDDARAQLSPAGTTYQTASRSEAPVVTPVDEPDEPPIVTQVDEPDASAGTSEHAPVGEAPALACPSDMVVVPSSTIHIGQPVGGRQSWPAPSPEGIAPIEVGAFCVHRLEVRQRDLEAWREGSGRAPRPRCPIVQHADLPAICVTDDEAAAFCEDHGAHLPTIAEWEALARTRTVHPSPRTSEWVEDLFPPAVVHRRDACASDDQPGCAHRAIRREAIPPQHRPAEPAAWFSWHGPVEQLRQRDVSFRCVVRSRPG